MTEREKKTSHLLRKDGFLEQSWLQRSHSHGYS